MRANSHGKKLKTVLFCHFICLFWHRRPHAQPSSTIAFALFFGGPEPPLRAMYRCILNAPPPPLLNVCKTGFSLLLPKNQEGRQGRLNFLQNLWILNVQYL